MRFFFHAAFLGTHYRGWQRQANAGSVQEVVEKVFSEILKEPISIMGCGRTDAQVHASQFFFHLEVKDPWNFDLLFRANKMLPNDIAIFEIIPVQDDQHAHFDATQRRYDYFIHSEKDPFLNPISTWYPEKKWNLEKMKQAIALLTIYKDYRAFCKSPDLYQHTLCHVSSAQLFTNHQEDRLRFQISADRFLGRMVRLLVGKLLQIGRNELSLEEFESYFITKKTPEVWDPAYPQGLFLSKVTYPYLDVPTRTTFAATEDSEAWIKI